jgi:hypothetical protein
VTARLLGSGGCMKGIKNKTYRKMPIMLKCRELETYVTEMLRNEYLENGGFK